MKAISVVTFILLVVGGLNWGLVGFFNYDLVAAIFGSMSPAARIIYILVGVSAIWCIFYCKPVGSPAASAPKEPKA